MEANNAAAMREALEELMKFTCNSCERRLCEDDAEEEDGQRVPSLCSAIIRARNALAAPPRNCDVGKAEEQCDRFLRFCQSRGCVNCEIGDGNRAKFPSCELVWAQMPYEEGGAK